MATNGTNRAAVIVPPSLPTIKETTLSWLGSELDSSIFSVKGQGDNDPAARQLSNKNIQRYIDFDEQCLSLKSGEESEFSGIQPLPTSSDDTPPTVPNNFNRVVRMDFSSLANQSHNRPKPILDCEDEDDDLSQPQGDTAGATHEQNMKIPASSLQELIGGLDRDTIRNEIANIVDSGGSGDNAAVEKLQLIRLWQLMQQEDLRRRQEAEIAVLNAQRVKMKLDRDQSSKIPSLEEGDPGLDSQDLDDIESTDLDSHNVAQQKVCEEPVDNDANSCVDMTTKNALIHSSGKNFDEIPVENAKAFEQLLEERLQIEERNSQVSAQLKPKGLVKRPFLRKGEGLARFKGPPVRKSKPQSKDLAKKPPKTSSVGMRMKPGKIVDIASDRVSAKPPTGAKKTKQTHPNQNLLQKVSMPNKTQMQRKQEISVQHVKAPKDISPYEVEDDQPRYFRPAGDADLEEFEMLERYAEDDASFFNEPSLVASVLQHESPSKDEKQLSLRDRVRERRRIREEARAKVQNTHSELAVAESHSHFHKYPEAAEEDEILSPLPPKPYFKSPEKNQTKIIQRKTASLVKKEKLIHPILHSPAFSPVFRPPGDQSSNHANLDIHTSPSSAFSPHSRHVVEQQQYTAYPQEDQVFADAVFMDDDFQDDQTWGDIDVSVNANSQLMEVDHKNKDESTKKYKCSDYMEPENEDAENPVRDTDPTPLSSARGLSLSPPPPPTTLMQKLFPSLKVPKPSLSASQHPSTDTWDNDERQAGTQCVMNQSDNKTSEPQASVLKQKLEELENEISRFKKENHELEKIRLKHEEDAQKLAREVEEFRKQKDEELARLEEYKKTETKKLKKEKKIFEEHVLATKMMPRKEEREEIQKLQEELDNLRSENQAKEHKWNSTCGRLRSQISSLKSENEDLQEQIEEMELQRIKDRKLMKAKTPKQPSIWETVNDIVDTTVVETEKNFPKGHSHLNEIAHMKQKKLGAKKTSTISPETAISNLRDTLERTKPRQAGVKETKHEDGKVEKILQDGRRIVLFPNGTQKEISSDGKMVKVLFANGDIKEVYGDGSIVYYYDENGTTHTTHPDGLQVFEFPNKQIEHHFADGTKQITFPDQTVKYLHTDGTEQTVFPDGTEMHIASNKDKTIVFANGQREIHTNSFKRREYPDGTSKTVFEDGRQETRYASGRLRVKDVHGNVIVDRMTT